MMILQAEIFENSTTAYTESVYQHDKNVTIEFEGADLPEKFKVVFSNTKDRGISVECEGSNSSILIPDELLSTGEYVYAWVRIHDDQNGRTTVATVVVPVIPRPVPIQVNPSSSEPCPEEHFKYEVDADEENLIFINSATMDGAIRPNIEEDD